jgi:peptidoglycan hydrolase-like protein with peptidoglycan-binding domain
MGQYAQPASRTSSQSRKKSPLQRGDSGRKVSRMQDQLQYLGMLTAEDKATGHGEYGGRTEQAVLDFEMAFGEENLADGVADSTTQAAITEQLAAQNRDTAVPPPLVKGDEGPRVTRLQEGLVRIGVLPEHTFENQRGRYTGKTARAVKEVQETAGLDPSGDMDADTWRALIPLAGKEIVSQAAAKGVVLTGDPVQKKGSEGPLVRELERLLSWWGSDIQPDGTYDGETADAVREFQQANSLTVDGKVNTATAAALVSGAAERTDLAASSAAGPATRAIQSIKDIRSLTYEDVVAVIQENNGDLFVDGDVTILALRTGNSATINFEDYFIVLKKNGEMETFLATTRPSTSEFIRSSDPSKDQDPAMLLAGNYDLSEKASQPGHYTWETAFNVKQDGKANDSSWSALEVAVAKDWNQDGYFSEEERASPTVDPYIRAHRGSPSGGTFSWGCLTVLEFDAFVDFIGSNKVPADLCIVDISKNLGNR